MSQPTIRIGACHLHLGSHLLRRGQQNLTLDPKEFGVLLQLVRSAPDIVTTRALRLANWRNVVVCDNALHQVIRRLRRQLGDSARNPSYIQTLTKVGYRLIADVEQADGVDVLIDALAGPIAVAPFVDYTEDVRAVRSSRLVEGLRFELCHHLVARSVAVVGGVGLAGSAERRISALEFGARSGAACVLSGSVLKQGDRLRVTAAVTDVVDGRLLWSSRYDVDASHWLDAQTDVAQSITDGLTQASASNGDFRQRRYG